MPDFSCSVSDISTDVLCADKGGLLTVFAAKDNTIDWEAMADSENYESSTNTILSWAMLDGAAWSKFTFERKSGRLDGTYTAETGLYEVVLQNLLFKGKSAARTITLGALASCCGLILQIHDNNSRARVLGKEYVAGVWLNPISRGRVTRHFDTTGAYGSAEDRSRDEMDFGAQHTNPLAYSSVSISEMEGILEGSAKLLGFSGTKVLGFDGTKVLGF